MPLSKLKGKKEGFRMRTLRKHGITLLEIMLAVFILALVIMPISQSLFSSAKATKEDESEVEALEKACEILDGILMLCDFDSVPSYPPDHPQMETLKFTEIKYSIEYNLVPLPTNFYIHKLAYHDPCPDGIEKNSSLTIGEDNGLTLVQLDREKLESKPPAQQVDLMDIKLTVKWKRRGNPDKDYDRHPIVLYTRKARL
jgi:hypothetical protein